MQTQTTQSFLQKPGIATNMNSDNKIQQAGDNPLIWIFNNKNLNLNIQSANDNPLIETISENSPLIEMERNTNNEFDIQLNLNTN